LSVNAALTGSPAKAGDPVITERTEDTRCPAFAGHDTQRWDAGNRTN
jgi:hypothetical protein